MKKENEKSVFVIVKKHESRMFEDVTFRLAGVPNGSGVLYMYDRDEALCTMYAYATFLATGRMGTNEEAKKNCEWNEKRPYVEFYEHQTDDPITLQVVELNSLFEL